MAWPLAARAQRAGKLPTIGFLGGSTAASSSAFTAVFLGRLRGPGWVEGRNIAVEYRWGRAAHGSRYRISGRVRSPQGGCDPCYRNAYALEAKRATSVIPIVFAPAGHPVSTGLVASLARPGGNVTGLSTQLNEAAGKRVELLREVVPGLRRLAVIANVVPESVLEIDDLKRAAGNLGLELTTIETQRSEDIALAFDTLKDRADALYIANSAFTAANRVRLTTLALGLCRQ